MNKNLKLNSSLKYLRKIFVITKRIYRNKLTLSQKFFFWGIIILLSSFIWYIFDDIKGFQYLLFLSIFIFACGVISDFLIIYKKLWATLLGKAIILLIYALGTNIAYGFAGQIVNEVIKFDASSMTRTISFVAILLIPLFIFILFSVAFVFVTIFIYFYIIAIHFIKSFKLKVKLEFSPWCTLVVRFVSYIIVFFSAIKIGEIYMPYYNQFLHKSTSMFIYYVESVKFTRCKDVPQHARVVSVNDDEIIVLMKTKQGYYFKPMSCRPILSFNYQEKQA